jgi:hypothetical protein
MVCDQIALSLQGGRRRRGIHDDRIVVTVHVLGRALDEYTHHLGLIADTPHHFSCNFQGNESTAKGTRFHHVLIFSTIP